MTEVKGAVVVGVVLGRGGGVASGDRSSAR